MTREFKRIRANYNIVSDEFTTDFSQIQRELNDCSSFKFAEQNDATRKQEEAKRKHERAEKKHEGAKRKHGGAQREHRESRGSIEGA